MPLWSFQGAHGHAPVQLEKAARGGLSKLNSVSEPEVDVVLGDPNDPDERPAEPADIDGFGSPRSEVLRIP